MNINDWLVALLQYSHTNTNPFLAGRMSRGPSYNRLSQQGRRKRERWAK